MLYLDTEFNGFGGELISIGIVSSTTGEEFYVVRNLPQKIDPWVRENVLPYLISTSVDDYILRSTLYNFLKRHEGEPIVADWPEDFTHLLNLICEPNGFMLSLELDMRLIKSGDLKSNIPHNAMSDARALMHWHQLHIRSQEKP